MKELFEEYKFILFLFGWLVFQIIVFIINPMYYFFAIGILFFWSLYQAIKILGGFVRDNRNRL